MKNVFKNALALVVTISLVSCSQNNYDKTNLTEGELFEQSVILKPTNSKNSDSKATGEALTYELVNYNEDYELKPAYVFNGFAFNDDGKYNDEIAGDHIYTSYELFTNSDSEKLKKNDGWVVSENFKYFDSLQSNKVKISCKIRWVDCTNTGFWDSDWGTGMGCLEFYDCEFTIEF